MSFLSLIFKNVWRHKTRTILTVLGISIGIATIVVFGLASTALKGTVSDMVKPGTADFTLAKAGVSDLMFSFITMDQVEKVKKIEGVKDVIPTIITIAKVGSNPYFMITGTDPNKLQFAGVKVTDGDAYQNNGEVIIGKLAAKNNKLGVGNNISLNGINYKITGIFESGISLQDAGALMTIEEAQKIQGLKDKITMAGVVVKDGFNSKEVAKKIESEDSELVSISDAADFEKVDQGTKIIDQMSIGISFLAVIIGAIGVMNTIIMSVFERTREIGVLRAVGWKKSRVVKMIIGESLIIGFLASIVGTAIGVLIIYLLGQTDLGEAWLNIKYEPAVFIQAFMVSTLVMIFGSIYPAFKASKLLPTEALRYE